MIIRLFVPVSWMSLLLCLWAMDEAFSQGDTTGSSETTTAMPSSQSNTSTEGVASTGVIWSASTQTSAQSTTRSESSTAETMTSNRSATLPSVQTESINAATGLIAGETTGSPSTISVLPSLSNRPTEAIPSTEIIWSASTQIPAQPTTRSESKTPGTTTNHITTLQPEEITSIMVTTTMTGETTGSPSTIPVLSLLSNKTTEVITSTGIIWSASTQTPSQSTTRSESSASATTAQNHTTILQPEKATSIMATATVIGCSADPILCCLGHNDSCRRGSCYCDEFCLTSRDCCWDYTISCRSGNTTGSSETTISVPSSQSNISTEIIPSTEVIWSTSTQATAQPTAQSESSATATTAPNNTTNFLFVQTESLNATTGETTESPSTISVLPTLSNRTTEAIPSTGIIWSVSTQTQAQLTTRSESSAPGTTTTYHTTILQPEETTSLNATTGLIGETKNFTVFNITTTSVSLKWEKTDANETSYLILILGEPSFNRTVTTTSFTVVGLVPGNFYTFVACVIVGNIKVKNYSTSTYTRPESVTNLKASNINMNSLDLSWDAPVGNRSFYIINIVGDHFLAERSFYESTTIGNLTARSTYLIKVSAVSGENAIQGNTKEISVTTNQASLFISVRFSSLLLQPEREQLVIWQVNKLLATIFPNHNLTAIWKAEKTS